MNHKTITPESRRQLLSEIRKEIATASGRKVLEYGSSILSLAAELRGELDYLACTDKSAEFLETFRPEAKERDILLIPDDELGEDCYFGRFHLVYTLFGLHGQSHLVDEIMRLRRLLLKGGKVVIIDTPAEGFDGECIKQLKRCGFNDPHAAFPDLEGEAAFMITVQK